MKMKPQLMEIGAPGVLWLHLVLKKELANWLSVGEEFNTDTGAVQIPMLEMEAKNVWRTIWTNIPVNYIVVHVSSFCPRLSGSSKMTKGI